MPEEIIKATNRKGRKSFLLIVPDPVFITVVFLDFYTNYDIF